MYSGYNVFSRLDEVISCIIDLSVSTHAVIF